MTGSKRARFQSELAPILRTCLRTSETTELWQFLTEHSNLPGPRGNLELAAALGDLIDEVARDWHRALGKLLNRMTMIRAEEAPVNDPGEFLPFCGAIGLGALGAKVPEYAPWAWAILRKLAGDPRWRLREAVAMGLQRMLARRPAETIEQLIEWAESGDPLIMRAVAAAVAEPSLLKNTEMAKMALDLHKTIFDRVSTIKDRKSESFRIVRKGLGYTLSVVVQAKPQEGFALMEELADSEDYDLQWIVKQNLRKNRLAKYYPDQVSFLLGRTETLSG